MHNKCFAFPVRSYNSQLCKKLIMQAEVKIAVISKRGSRQCRCFKLLANPKRISQHLYACNY